MNSTLNSSKKTSTVLSPGFPRDRPIDPDSQPLPGDNLLGTFSPADILESEPVNVRFVDQSHFDQAVHTLRFSDSVAERVVAARTLGNIGSELATSDLIASLFDPERDVRSISFS
jgi:hypothetical protein